MTDVAHLLAHADPAYRRWVTSIPDEVLLDSGVALHSLDTLSERNTTYEVPIYLPGHLMIGNDSGGAGFVIACDGTAGPVFTVGLGSLQEDDFTEVAATFQSWADDGFPLP